MPTNCGSPVTGVSGSGKSSLVFGTIAAESQRLIKVTWPDGPHAQQMHLDLTVATTEELAVQHECALALGADLLRDRSDGPEEPLYVYRDRAGHPFGIFVAQSRPWPKIEDPSMLGSSAAGT